jgi:gas vesicle protein GvpN
VATVLRTSPRRFVSTPAIERLTVRALRYLQSGFSVHLRGPAGTGKTTLSLYLADLLERPMMLMFGDDEAKSSDLVGKQSGYTRKKVVDNYIHSVLKVEDQVRQTWVDSRLTLACREGYTLIYDEFNRSRPEVNNILLSVLEEKLLILPPESNGVEYVKVSPHFRAIFTSNPEEYCGVHSTQDALMDRLITIDVPEPDELTQQEIVVQKTELDRATARTIVNVVRSFREGTLAHSASGIGASGLRSCLMIGKICKDHEIEASYDNAEFRDLCLDILQSRSPLSVEDSTTLIWQILRPETSAVQQPSALRDLIPVVVKPAEEFVEQIETPIEDIFNSSIETVFDEPIFEETIEDTIEETIPLLDDATMQAVLEEADDRMTVLEMELPIEDEMMADDTFQSLEQELFDSAGFDSEGFDSEGSDSHELETIGLDSISQNITDSCDHELELSTEDELYVYLKTLENGARLSQIESDLRLPRSKAVEAIRSLAKNNRLAQRDRHFFAI